MGHGTITVGPTPPACRDFCDGGVGPGLIDQSKLGQQSMECSGNRYTCKCEIDDQTVLSYIQGGNSAAIKAKLTCVDGSVEGSKKSDNMLTVEGGFDYGFNTIEWSLPCPDANNVCGCLIAYDMPLSSTADVELFVGVTLDGGQTNGGGEEKAC